MKMLPKKKQAKLINIRVKKNTFAKKRHGISFRKVLMRSHGYVKVWQFPFLPERGKLVPDLAAALHVNDDMPHSALCVSLHEFIMRQGGSEEV